MPLPTLAFLFAAILGFSSGTNSFQVARTYSSYRAEKPFLKELNYH